MSEYLLKDSFNRSKITEFFSFSTLNILVHSLLASKDSDEKSVDNLIENHPHVMICFSLATFKILCPLRSLIIMGLRVGLFYFLLGIHCASWCLHPCVSSNLGSFQSLFLYVCLCLCQIFSGIPIICMLVCLMIGSNCLRVCSWFPQSFLFLRLTTFHCPIFQVCWFFFFCLLRLSFESS